MEFFDKLGKKASEAYKITADKTGKLAKETKIKIKINDLKSQINDIYEQIGQRVYQKHVREDDEDMKKEVEEMCIKIDVLSDEIENLLKQSLELKDKKQCKVCAAQIDADANYCSNCGAEQEKPVKEVEVIEKEENEDANEETKAEENKDANEDINEENEEAENLEKTVEVESDVKEEE